MWFMPLVFSVMFFFFPAGLVLYWITNNVLSIAQQWLINTRMGVPPQFNLPKFDVGRSRHRASATPRAADAALLLCCDDIAPCSPASTNPSPPSPPRPAAAPSASCGCRRRTCSRDRRRLRPRAEAARSDLPALPRRRRQRHRPGPGASTSRRRTPTPAKTCWSCRRTAARWCCSCCWRAAWKPAPRWRCAWPSRASSPQRAFLNGKIDLAQAEAIADLIDASTEAAARSASRSLAGEFSREIHALRDALIHLRMLVEATLDFPEEEIDFLQKADAQGQLRAPAGEPGAR